MFRIRKGENWMHTYHIAVCEDDRLIQKTICDLCDEILTASGTIHEITSFSSAEELEQFLEKQGQIFDLLVLDIQMGEKSGMEFARELRARKDRVSILFVTGYDGYLKEGYSVQPVQFLLKPVRRAELEEALMTDLELKHRMKYALLQKGSRSLRIVLDDVLYAEANGNHKIRIFQEKREDDFPVGLSELEQLLPADRFIRCHNSYLINLDHVIKYEKSSFYLEDNTRIPVGRKFTRSCQDALIAYVNQ